MDGDTRDIMKDTVNARFAGTKATGTTAVSSNQPTETTMSEKKPDYIRKLAGILNDFEEWIKETPLDSVSEQGWAKIENIRASLEHVISQEVGQKGKR